MAAGSSPARPTTCPDGEIGRHRRLKICCALLGAYRFESGSGTTPNHYFVVSDPDPRNSPVQK
ncbi:hypothetical protein BCEP4_60134 [Burkholderia cepacia]|nr:hypothetical protein BCEP4_60134 [Burkholderia cepacia]